MLNASRPSLWPKLSTASLLVALLVSTVAQLKSTQGPVAAQSTLYSDERFQRWSQLYLAGEADALIRAVEADAAGPAPHPLAAYVWYHASRPEGKPMPDLLALAGTAPPQLRQAVQVLALCAQSRDEEVIRQFASRVGPGIGDAAAERCISIAAGDSRRSDLEWAWAKRSLSRYPNEFLAIWLSINAVYRDRSNRAEIDETLKNTHPEPALQAALAQLTPTGERDWLAAVKGADLWLASHSGDAKAHRFRATALELSGDWGGAVAAYRTATELDPFDDLNWTALAEAQSMSDESAEALQTLERFSRLSASPSHVELVLARTTAKVLVASGEKGKARRHLDSALLKWPSDVVLNSLYSDVEAASGRHALAAEFAKRAMSSEPANPEVPVQLVDALRESGRSEEALALIDQVLARPDGETVDAVGARHRALRALKRHREALLLAQQRAADRPTSAYFHRLVAESAIDLGDDASAQVALEQALAIDAQDQWSASRLSEVLVRLNGKAGATVALDRVLRQIPESTALWHRRADLEVGETAREAVFRAAQRSNAGRAWPWLAIADTYLAREDAAGAKAAVVQGAADPELGLAGSQTSILRAKVVLVLNSVENGRSVGPEELGRALGDLEEYFRAGGRDHPDGLRAQILAALGRRREAGVAAWANARRYPDEVDQVWQMANQYFDEVGRKLFVFAHRLVERDPFDGERLHAAADLHSKWGGSPIAALRLMAWAKERAPRFYHSDDEARAFGKLGDTAKSYAEAYGRFFATSPIAESDRYIGWFDDARAQVANGSDDVSVDVSSMKATIRRRDGQIVRRTDDPVSGQPVRVEVGAAWVRAEYRSDGDVRLIESSSGERLNIDYNADGLIHQITGSNVPTVTLEYNDQAKPRRIVADSIGSLEVTYGPGNSIEKVESPEGPSVAIRVSQTFNRLSELTELISKRPGDIPDLPRDDPALDALQEAATRTAVGTDVAAAAEASLDVAEYLIDHQDHHRRYVDEADERLRELIDTARSGEESTFMVAAKAARAWIGLMRRTRPEGLSSDDFRYLRETAAWLESVDSDLPAVSLALRSAATELRGTSLGLLPSAKWVPSSPLANPGYWRRFRLNQVLPRNLINEPPRAVVVRRDGGVVVSAGSGIAVFERGYWLRYGIVPSSGRLSTTDGDLNDQRYVVTSLTEDAAGHLVLGTAAGLAVLEAAYDGPVLWFRGSTDGLPGSRVARLAAGHDSVYVATDLGLARLTSTHKIEGVDGFDDAPIRFIWVGRDQRESGDPLRDDNGQHDVLLVGTAQKVVAVRAGRPLAVIAQEPRDAAVFVSSQRRVVMLRGSELDYVELDGADVSASVALPGRHDVVMSRRISGLEVIETGAGETVAIATDMGLSLFADEHVEHLDLPFVDKRAGAALVSARGGHAAVVGPEGVHLFELGRTTSDVRGRVYDLLTPPGWGATFVARGSGLEVVEHADSEAGAKPFADLAATHLAVDGKGNVVTNDGLRIVRVERGNSVASELFTAEQTASPEGAERDGRVTSLIVDSQEAIWVTAGASVFRYDGREAKEYSIFVDAQVFPARSDMISRVLETVDGRVWVIASNEGHRYFRGAPLRGGVLEWDGQAFRRLRWSDERPNDWFVTGYTPIAEGLAIVGTVKGFLRHSSGRLSAYGSDLVDTSYRDAIQSRQFAMWLGRKGAALGNGFWIFGTAGGVVGYKDGRWIVLDRVNWMLPDQKLAAYGGRTVHAVATDEEGRIYAGTDRGLLVLSSGGADASALLVSEGVGALSFDELGAQQTRREADVLLNHENVPSSLGQTVARVRASARDLEMLETGALGGYRLEQRVSPTRRLEGRAEAVGTGAGVFEKLREQLEAKRRAHASLLLEIERSDRSLYQMLEVKPLDLAGLRSKLPDDALIVQYLPTAKRLYIQLVTRAGAEIREVEIAADELVRRTTAAVAALGCSADPQGCRTLRPGQPTLSGDPKPDLAWLYDHLLRPIELELDQARSIVVVPAGKLAYLPFAALIRKLGGSIEYAAERYSFSMMPSLYLLELALDNRPSRSNASLLLGDPDGSLPAARAEVHAVQSIVGGQEPPSIGADATMEVLRQRGPAARVIHMATHGVMDAARPERSYLLLADGARLTMVDVMGLNLSETDIAVLSACESARGVDGMEYATLARAFAHAGVPALVATLWSVPDMPTMPLMRAFYTSRQAGNSNAESLAKAQRAALAGEVEQARDNPGRWAAFILLGVPW